MTEVDAASFRSALARFASGVTVITTVDSEGRDHGMTASAFTSLSLEPPLILVCIKQGNSTYRLIEERGAFAVNILSRSQEALSNRFAGGIVDEHGNWSPWPQERDRFADLQLQRTAHSGAAGLEGSLAILDCTLEKILPGGDHGIFVGRIQDLTLAAGEELDPLLYGGGSYGSFLADR
ncbi:MAG: hypothetical protein CMP23_15365 [Rickettsiales bacterium]|nr:hypothetical protein [Rickettsiales bacterium]|tara:strand:- start:1317 stop:1853 length:537 start_codon:yes stop_codon:yes gene_type:complete